MREARKTTDPQEEPLELFDPAGFPLGQVKARGLVHRDGDWHGAFHVWISWRKDDEIWVLLQRRSITKDTMPGCVDVSVGGHCRAGEHPQTRCGVPPHGLTALQREVEEELGLPVAAASLFDLGRRWVEYVGPAWIDREVQDVYAVLLPNLLHQLRPELHEVQAILRISAHALRDLLTGRLSAITALSQQVLADGSLSPLTVIRLARGELVPGVELYWMLVTEQLERIWRGDQVDPFVLRSPGV